MTIFFISSGRPRLSRAEDLPLPSPIPPETKNGDHAFSLGEIRRNPQRGAVCSYLDFFRLGVNRGIMNSCAMAAITRSASLMPNASMKSPPPRFESG